MICSTVNICAANGSYIVINESDFDEDKHEIFEPKELKEGSVDWLKAELAVLEVEVPDGAKKADLEILLDDALAE